MKSGLLACLLLLLGLLACSSRNPSASIGTGFLYYTTQGDSQIWSYSVALSTGGLTALGPSVGTGTTPFAITITPTFSTLFVDNQSSGDISTYTVGSGGALIAASGTTKTGGSRPTGMVTDPAGKFLFVANQLSNSVSVFSINGTTLQAVAGSPFCTIVGAKPPSCTPPAGILPDLPAAVVVSATGSFLYVANTFSGTVAAFSIGSSGALTQLGASPYTAGIAPSGLGITPSGAFLYVANSGSNNVSAFSICDKVVTTCTNPNSPDGTLTPVSGSPFAAGLGPVAVAADPSFNFLYVLDQGSNQISEYSFSSGTGVLSPLSPPSVSTGITPASLVILSGTTGTYVGNVLTNPTDYVYVTNNGASTLSPFTLNTTSGVLTPLGQALTTTGNPSAIAAN